MSQVSQNRVSNLSKSNNIPPKIVQRRDKIFLTNPLNSNKEDFINSLTQNNVAWIFLGKEIEIADPQSLELASGWISNQIHKLGRCAKVYAKLRGSSTVNYVDMKQAIQDEFREEYSRLYHNVGFPPSYPFPRVIPKLSKPKLPIIAQNSSWESLVDGNQQSDQQIYNFNTQIKRPSSIPQFMPMFPTEYLYKNTIKPWIIEHEKSPEKRLLFQKMELQVQIPQLHDPELQISDIFSSFSNYKNNYNNQENNYWGSTISSDNSAYPVNKDYKSIN